MKTCRRPFAPSLIAAAIAAWTMAAAPFAAPGTLEGQQYGASIAVGGQQVLVGEPGAGALPGVVYVYGRSGGAWGEVGRLSVSAAPGPPDGFGRALAAEGDLVMVGAPAWEDGAGAVFVYRADGRGRLDRGRAAVVGCAGRWLRVVGVAGRRGRAGVGAG